jgi:membrane fusion protein (multidrug efflux system)
MQKIFRYILIFSLVLFFASCNKKQQKKPEEAIPVTISIVKETKENYYSTYPGNLVALNQVELRSQISGDITKIYISDGQSVKKGQKLYEIQPDIYEASYNQAKANLHIAKDNLEKAQKDADRYTKLAEQDAIAKQRLDYAQTDLKNAKSQVAAAQQDLEKARTNLNYSIITAPFDGTIGISQVKLGATVTPGQTLLNVISSNDPIAVDFNIDQKELTMFEKFLDNKNKNTSEDSTFRINLPGDVEYPYSGKISFIDRAVNPQTGTITVRLVFPNKEKALKPGMTCTVDVLNVDSVPRIIIPYKAVLEQMSEFFVFIVHGQTVNQIKVKPGTQISDNIIIEQGLKANDTIVTEGIQKLKNGSKVQFGDENNRSNSRDNRPH